MTERNRQEIAKAEHIESLNAKRVLQHATVVSDTNSSTTLLTNGSSFTGSWVDVTAYDSIIVAVKTDQNGTFSVQYSPDAINIDSTLNRYYRIGQIEAPHRFTNTRKYARVVFTNDSGSDQTYFRLQTLLGDKANLNAPMDSTLSQDFDATAVRPTDYHSEVALGKRQGSTLWNKFGYNVDIDIGTEVIASWGGTFTPLTTATTLSIVSTSSVDTNGGTGTNSIYISGIDANRDEQFELVTLNGTTPVVTTSTWLGINRVAMYLCGTGQINAGTINVTAVTGGSTMAQMPAGDGVTQQCIFHIPRSHTFLTEWLRFNTLNPGNKNATLTFKVWVWSALSNGKQEVYRMDLETQRDANIDESPLLPFPITEATVMWVECTSDKADIKVNARISGELIRDVDA